MGVIVWEERRVLRVRPHDVRGWPRYIHARAAGRPVASPSPHHQPTNPQQTPPKKQQVRVARSGYPVRLPHAEFYARYRCLATAPAPAPATTNGGGAAQGEGTGTGTSSSTNKPSKGGAGREGQGRGAAAGSLFPYHVEDLGVEASREWCQKVLDAVLVLQVFVLVFVGVLWWGGGVVRRRRSRINAHLRNNAPHPTRSRMPRRTAAAAGAASGTGRWSGRRCSWAGPRCSCAR